MVRLRNGLWLLWRSFFKVVRIVPDLVFDSPPAPLEDTEDLEREKKDWRETGKNCWFILIVSAETGTMNQQTVKLPAANDALYR